MGYDKVKLKQIRRMILFIAAVILVIKYSSVFFLGLKLFLGIITPFLIGGMIAFVINIPMQFLENRILGNWKGKTAVAVKRPLCMLLAVAFLCSVVYLIIIAVVPQLAITITMLGEKVPGFIQKGLEQLDKLTKNYPVLAQKVDELQEIKIDWNTFITNVGGFLKNGLASMLTSTVSVASSIISGIVNTIIGIVFAVYLLGQKEKLADQGKRILSAYLTERPRNYVLEILRRLYVNFKNFICGQCLEAMILGSMFVVTMSIIRMPFAVMIGVLIAFTALIPIVGACIGCGAGVLMMLIEDPVQAVAFLILFLIIQQIETNMIYPRVVGNSVGLPSIWVLASVAVGGSLFGVVGMIVFIPMVSTVYSLLRDDVNSRNLRKKVTIPAGIPVSKEPEAEPEEKAKTVEAAVKEPEKPVKKPTPAISKKPKNRKK